MTPEEIAWLEEHQQLEVAHAAAAQVEAAWQAHHGRTEEALASSKVNTAAAKARLDEHEKERPEPVDNDPDQAEGVDA